MLALLREGRDFSQRSFGLWLILAGRQDPGERVREGPWRERGREWVGQ